ncbi:MAG TPA: trehalase family glycosidase [Chloroflexia bacterium]|nr:trehalase family glycosidase [Chloroflexia bacterium]
MNGLAYGKRRALNEMHSIFGCQWASGMLPQIRFMTGPEGGGEAGYRPNADDWGVTPEISGPTHLRTSGITQPPIVGLCAHDLFRKLTEAERAAHLADFLAFSHGLRRFHAWLLSKRDPWGEGLALCLHPWETGTDNSPAFDLLIEATRRYAQATNLPVHLFGRADTTHVPHRQRPTHRDYFAYFGLVALFKKLHYRQRDIIEASPFLLQDVLFNSLLAASLLAHGHLQVEIAGLLSGSHSKGADRGELLAGAEESRELYHRVSAAIRRKLWHPDDGFFYSFDSRKNRPLPTPTVSGFGPLLPGIASDEQAARLVEHLTRPGRFGTPVPVPSTPADSPAFDPLRYWSGPSWPVTNWLVIRALRERHNDQALRLREVLRRSTLAMIEEGAGAEHTRRAAALCMEANSVGEEFTTPSRRQYQHGWLWDSAIAAACWPLVPTKPGPAEAAAVEVGTPGFWEYYHPHTGEPLGAPRMTWTAALYLELLHMGDTPPS